jgi:hypothetical protein
VQRAQRAKNTTYFQLLGGARPDPESSLVLVQVAPKLCPPRENASSESDPMMHFTRSKPTHKNTTASQRAAQAAELDALCEHRPLRPPTSTRPEVRLVRKALPASPRM